MDQAFKILDYRGKWQPLYTSVTITVTHQKASAISSRNVWTMRLTLLNLKKKTKKKCKSFENNSPLSFVCFYDSFSVIQIHFFAYLMLGRLGLGRQSKRHAEFSPRTIQ